jgi:hypothetical protein
MFSYIRIIARSALFSGCLLLPVYAFAAHPNPIDRIAALEATTQAQAAQITSLQSALANQSAQIASLQSLLQHFSRNGNEIYITGANLNIRDGSGHTWGHTNDPGFPVATGLGNLIIGYNEAMFAPGVKTGSHNLILGLWPSYSSVGGIVAGRENTISGAYATVVGGDRNTASADTASVTGGSLNSANFVSASVTGGAFNAANGGCASVTGGARNVAVFFGASVTGGEGNTAQEVYSSVNGGATNFAGGRWSVVSGGSMRSAPAPQNWAAGALFQSQ